MTDVPHGTSADVLDWVGDDPDRARAALEAERDGPNRSTLIAKLETIASKEASMADEPTTTEEEVEEAPGPQPPAGDDLSIDLLDNATYIGPANLRDADAAKPDDSYDLVQAQARADEDDEAVVDATSVEFFQIAATSGVVVLNFDGTAVLLDANQAAALAKDLKGALAGVTY